MRWNRPLRNRHLDPCVNASGIMDYPSATAWVLAMNNANYLGHSNWQLPTTPSTDPSCAGTGADGNSFGFGCNANALGYLYYKALGFHAPNTAVPIPADRVGPFRNFQPQPIYSNDIENPIAYFNFVDGSQGGGTGGDFQYVLPMIQGKIPGTPPAAARGCSSILTGRLSMTRWRGSLGWRMPTWPPATRSACHAARPLLPQCIASPRTAR